MNHNIYIIRIYFYHFNKIYNLFNNNLINYNKNLINKNIYYIIIKNIFYNKYNFIDLIMGI